MTTLEVGDAAPAGLTVRAADADVDAAAGRVQRVGGARGERRGGVRVQQALQQVAVLRVHHRRLHARHPEPGAYIRPLLSST